MFLRWEKVFLRFFFGWQLWFAIVALLYWFDPDRLWIHHSFLRWTGTVLLDGMGFTAFMIYVQLRKHRPPSDL